MRLITKLWATLLLLCVAGVANAATEYEVDQRFTSISDLDGKSFAIVDETPTTPTAMGIGITGHGQGWDMYFGTITEAYNSNACFYKLEAVTTEGLEGYYYLRTYKADGNMYTAWGNTTTMGYFNSQFADKSCCFALGLEGRNGQDGTNLAIWAIEVNEGKFALKNIGTGLYLHADNLPAKYEDAFYFTFCSLKEKAQTDPLADQKDALNAAIAKGKMIKAIAYTEATFGALTTAVTDGETALASTEATATSLTNATNAITNAIEALALKEGYTNLTKDIYKLWNSNLNPTEGSETGCAYTLFESTGQPYGDGSVQYLRFADISEYSKLILTVADGTPRIMMNRLEPLPEGTEGRDANGGAFVEIKDAPVDGVVVVDLTQYDYAHLNAIKGANWANVTLTGMYLYKEATVADGDVLPIDIQFGESYNNKKVQNYTSTWTATKDGKTWTIVNFNNNNSGWTSIKCGSKSDASVATITSPAINAVVKSYVISLTKVSNINSAKLTIMNGEEKVGEDIDITEKFVVGDVVVPVESQKGYSYILTIDNKKASGNGSVEISKITLSGEAIQPVEPVHIENTAETAYTVAKAIELIDAGEALSETVFVKGIVSKVDEYNEQYKNISYWISDDGTTESAQFECFRGKGIDGADFTSIDDIKVGATVIVKGTMKKYVKEGQADIYEFNQNNELVSYEAPVAPAELFAGETGKYYIFNTAAEKYLGAGNSWGTQASLLKNPVFVTLIKQEDGTYQLESQVSNGGTNYYFNGNFMDSNAPVNLTITKIPEAFGYKDDNETEPVYAYTIATGEKFYGWDGTTTVLASNLTADNENAAWLIFTEAEVLNGLKSATTDDPVDATFLIADPNFGRNNRYQDKWTMVANNKNLSGGEDKNGTIGNNCAESWHSTFTLSQTLADAPAGIYALTAQGFYGQDGSDNEHLPVFYANDATQTFPLKTGSEASMTAASQSFSAGKYTIEPLIFELKEGETLTIGAKLEGNASLWCIWDNFELFYYGNETTVEQVKNAAIIAELEKLRTNASEKIEDAEVEAVKTALQDALTATAEVDKSDAEAIKTAITTLKAAVEKAEASLEAKAKLAKMKELIDATNVYTAEAKNAYYDQWVVKYNDGTITKTEANALQDPFLVTGWHANVTVDNFLLSAWDTNPDFQDAAYYINTWSTEGDNDGSNFKVPFFEYFGNPLPAKTLTATMNGLEPGKYDVTAWVRVAPADKTAEAANGVTLQLNDGEAVDACTGEQFDCDAERFFIKEVTATGVVAEDGVLKIKFNVAEDNNIHWLSFKNVKFTKKLPTYKVNEVVNDIVVRTTMGESELGKTVKVPYRHYNVLEGKLYSKGVTSKEYNYSFNFNTDEQVENITYAATDKEGIVFLTEGEDIDGLTLCTSGNTAVRSSNSASAYAADADVAITKLQAGTYKLTAAIFDASKNPNSTWAFLADNDTIAKLNCTAVNYQELTSGKFTLEKEATLYLAKGGNANMGLDLVYVQAVEAETPIFAYTVNEMVGEHVVRTTTGTAEKDATVKVPFREYNTYEGKLYKKSQISKEFNYSFKLTADNQEENLTYSEVAGVEDVVFLSEGEDIQGLTPITTGNTAIRSSNSAAAYAAEGDVEIVKLPAGTYKIVAVIYDSSKTPNSHWIFKAGNEQVADLNCTTVNIQELSSEEFTLEAETAISMAQGGSASMGLDLIYIVKAQTPDAINSIAADAQKTTVFNLNGQKVNKAQKGLFIINGKKVIK